MTIVPAFATTDLLTWAKGLPGECIKQAYDNRNIIKRLRRFLDTPYFLNREFADRISLIDQFSTSATFFGSGFEILYYRWPSGEPLLIPYNPFTSTLLLHLTQEYWIKFYPFINNYDPVSQKCHLDLGQFGPKEYLDRMLYVEGRDHFGHYMLDIFTPLLHASANGLISSKDSLVPAGIRITDFTKLYMESLSLLTECDDYFALDFKSSKRIVFECSKLVDRKIQISTLCRLAAAGIVSFYPSLESIRLSSKCFDKPRACLILRRYKGFSWPPGMISDIVTSISKILPVDILDMRNLTFYERISIMASYELVISQSGSTFVNALFFSSPESKIILLQDPYILQYSHLAPGNAQAFALNVPAYASQRIYPYFLSADPDVYPKESDDLAALPCKFDSAHLTKFVQNVMSGYSRSD